MKNSDIEQKLKAVVPHKYWGHSNLKQNTLFALIQHKESKNPRKYKLPEWVLNYYGIANIIRIYPEDTNGKIAVTQINSNNPRLNVYIPHAREVLRILTLEEVQNEYPEYLI